LSRAESKGGLPPLCYAPPCRGAAHAPPLQIISNPPVGAGLRPARVAHTTNSDPLTATAINLSLGSHDERLSRRGPLTLLSRPIHRSANPWLRSDSNDPAPELP
jgi:hypothetical protein